MEIAAQVAAAVSVSRGRVSVRICEHRGQTLALEVSLWEAQAGRSARGSQMTASALASELMRQAFSGTSVLRSQPLLTKISAANLLLGSAKSRLGSGAPVPAIDGEANRLTPHASAFAVTPALQVEQHPSVMKAHKVHHKHLTKEEGECFGMLFVPRKYWVDAKRAMELKRNPGNPRTL